MDGRVDRAIGERLLELLDKESLAADIGERRRRHLVAAGAYLDDFNFDAGEFSPLSKSRTIDACASASLLGREPMRILSGIRRT